MVPKCSPRHSKKGFCGILSARPSQNATKCKTFKVSGPAITVCIANKLHPAYLKFLRCWNQNAVISIAESVWHLRPAAGESAAIRGWESNAHNMYVWVSHTLSSLRLSSSPSVAQAAAVNRTCSFTDACVGGSESKITERLCACVCDSWVCVFVAETSVKEKWVEEGDFMLISTISDSGDSRWDTECDVNGADGLKRRKTNRECDSSV